MNNKEQTEIVCSTCNTKFTTKDALGNTPMESMRQEHFPANIAGKDISGDPVYPNIRRNVDKLHIRQIKKMS